MRKLFIFLLCFFNILNTSASVENKAVITKISYLNYYESNKEITITGSNLDTCDDLSFKWYNLKILKQTSTSISFQFHDLTTSWKLDLLCKWWKISNFFYIPYISSIKIKNDYSEWKTITINWKNFWENPSVKLIGWTFNKITSTKTSITWVISWKLTSNNIYVVSEWFKSNLYYTKLEIPKINYIKSESNFLYETDIFLYWDYLIKSNDLELFINDKKHLNFKHDKDNKYIKIKLSEKLW